MESDFLLIQLKATDVLRRVNTGQDFALTLERRDLEAWIVNRVPVFLILYDVLNEAGYWMEIQNRSIRNALTNRTGDTLTLHLPVANRVDGTAVAEMRRIKNQTNGGG